MKKKLILLFFLSHISLFSQKVITKKFKSDELKSTRDLKIFLPKGYVKDSTTNYPLTIILDDEKLANLYVANATLFVRADITPKQIVVSINTTKTANLDFGFHRDNDQLTKSSQNFQYFIKDELIPYMDANYKTSPFLTIVGEGLSANFITYFLKERTPIFNAYVCINPLLPIGINQNINAYALKRYEKEDNEFYFYLSNNPFNNNTKKEKIVGLASFLNNLSIKNFHIKIDDFKNAPSYVSALSEAIPRSQTKIFEKYAGISKKEFEKNIKDLLPLDAIEYLEKKYIDIEFLFGTNLGIRTQDIYAIEDIIIDKENGDYLKIFGKMILNLYPKSPLGNYYIGKYYESGKLYNRALKEYKIAYSKFEPSDPNAELFYENILRLTNR